MFAEEVEECLLLEEEDEEEEEEEVDDVTDFEATAAAFANDAKPPKELLLFTGDWEVDTLEAGLVERADNDGNANKDFEANIEVLVLLLVGPKPDLIEDVCELPDTEWEEGGRVDRAPRLAAKLASPVGLLATVLLTVLLCMTDD